MSDEIQKTPQALLKEKLLNGSITEKDFLLEVLTLDQETDVALGTRPHAKANADLLKDTKVRTLLNQQKELKDFWEELEKMVSAHVPFEACDPREIGHQMSSLYSDLETVPKEVVDEFYRKRNLSYSISIDAPIETVFKTITDKSMYPKWTKAWGEGMTFEGEWKQGEHISFIDNSGEGTKARLDEVRTHFEKDPTDNGGYAHIPSAYVTMIYIAKLKDGTEVEKLDEPSRRWVGTREEYRITENEEGVTKLWVYISTDESFEQKMNDSWPTSLQNLKEICEQ